MITFNKDTTKHYIKNTNHLVIYQDDIESLNGLSDFLNGKILNNIHLRELHNLQDVSDLNNVNSSTITIYDSNFDFNILKTLNTGKHLKLEFINCEFVDFSFVSEDFYLFFVELNACNNIINFKKLLTNKNLFKLTIINCNKLEVSSLNKLPILEYFRIEHTAVPNIHELLPFNNNLACIDLKYTQLPKNEEYSNEKRLLDKTNQSDINEVRKILLTIKLKENEMI